MERLRDNQKGMTLAEIIVTFALMGIFLAAVTGVITSSIRVQSEMTGTMYAQSVGEILLDKVTGELSFAQVAGEEAVKTGIVLKDGEVLGGGVAFFDRDGVPSAFLVQDGILCMQGQHPWQMEEGAYMGYRITSFQVERLNDENIFDVKISIKNLKNGFEYSASKAVKCYNFRTLQDYEKIVEGEIVLSDFT
ncbi:MAG: type II secretion system protein [Lachnospiraceae bacterium]|nr:type II secretion system protein [Lachnospiraceae bacterium]